MLPTQLLALLLSAAFALLPAAHGFACHPQCKCIWRNGKKTAECPYAALTGLPAGIDEELQVLNLTNNNVQVLPKNAFYASNLVNVQKLYLSHCSIAHMDDNALFKVSNLIELDLSWNSLASVPSGAWIHVKHLRTLLLNGNPITVLPDNAFAELRELSALMMTECNLETISPGAFEGLSNLNVLKLDYNRLQTLSGKAMVPLKSLHGMALDGNHWRCDCDLRSFRAWLDKHNVSLYLPTCQQPPRLKGKSWNAVSVEDLACAPVFLNTNPSDSIVAQEHSNVTLECRVRADPLPDIEWYLKDILVTNTTEGVNAAQFFSVTQQVAGDREKLSWLTVTAVQERNAGAYTCVAKNSAGKAEHNYTLAVNRKTAITEVRASGSSADVEMTEQARESTEQQQRSYRENPLIGMIIGIVVGAMAVLLVFGLVLWVCRRRGRRRSHPSTRKKRTEVVVNHKVVNHNDIGKEQLPSAEVDTPDVKLLAVVNPVQKPPRLMMADSYNGLPSELEPLDPNQEMCTPSGVWIVKDHEYSTDESVLSSVPSRVGTIDRRSIAGARSPIPVPMPVVPPPPPDDLHFRLQNELTDTLRRSKGDRRPIIGDDSSDGHCSLYGGGLETLRVRDLEGRVRGSGGPDLIDQLEDSRGSHQESPSPPPLPMGSHWRNSYDHPSAYYRTAPGPSYPQELPPSIPETTGDGTEV